jgi:lysophospholipase L1-like esterase
VQSRFERIPGPVLAVVTTVLCLGIAELGLRVFAPVPRPYERPRAAAEPTGGYIRSYFSPNLDLETHPEPGLPGMTTGPNRFTTNNLGFRGPELARPKPPSEYRIFLVGGSTAECLYLDDDDALNAVLQDALEDRIGSRLARVYNAGKSGDRSDDHISMVVHRLVHLEPDLIVLFAGINDVRASVFGYDYLHYQPPRSVEPAQPEGLGVRLRLAVYELQIGRRLYYLLKRVQPPSRMEMLQAIPLTSNYRERVAEQRAAPLVPDAPEADVAAYERNLRTIAGVARGQGIGLVLMTQQTTWASTDDPGVEQWQWMLLGPDGRYEAAAMAAQMEEINEAMRRVARDEGLPLYDTVAEIPPTLEYFYDDVHFNVAGARKAGEGVARLVTDAAAAAGATARVGAPAP